VLCGREEPPPDDLSAWETREADRVRCQVAVPSTRGVGGWERKKREKETRNEASVNVFGGRRSWCVEYMLNYISCIVDVASYLTPLSYPIMRQPFGPPHLGL